MGSNNTKARLSARRGVIVITIFRPLIEIQPGNYISSKGDLDLLSKIRLPLNKISFKNLEKILSL